MLLLMKATTRNMYKLDIFTSAILTEFIYNTDLVLHMIETQFA